MSHKKKMDESSELRAGGELHQHAGKDVPVLTTQQGIPVSDDQNSLRRRKSRRVHVQ